MKQFDYKNATLNKHTVIEASAGTGKTYTLEHLATRMLTEPLPPFQKPCSLSEILIITYTEKAANELKERIRKNIQKQLNTFKAESSNLESINRLENALSEYDTAPIYTIHGFCHRTLQEFAFENSLSFKVEVEDSLLLLPLMLQDFFRKLTWTPQEYALFSQFFSPAAIKNSLRFLLSHGLCGVQKQNVFIKGNLVPSEKTIKNLLSPTLKNTLLDEIQKHHQTLKNPTWKIKDFIQQLKHPAINKRSINSTRTKEWQTLLETLLNSNSVEAFHQTALKLEKMIDDRVLEEISKTGDQVLCSFFASLKKIHASSKEYEDLLHKEDQAKAFELFYELAKEVFLSLNHHKRLKSLLSFDDMIRYLHDSIMLHKDSLLIKGIRKKFKIALIDEFQDTDHYQWDIFRTLFLESSNHTLFMIGDPKQSIYRYRGADLHVYHSARNLTKETLHLNVNYRSQHHLIEGLNNLFSIRPLFQTPLEWNPVIAGNPEISLLTYKQNEIPPISFLHVQDEIGIGDARELFGWHMVSQIEQMLSPDSPYQLKGNRIRAEDIAVLLRTNDECAEIQKKLFSRNIPSIIKKQKGLFQTREASDTLAILKAIANPSNIHAILPALTTLYFENKYNDFIHWPSEQLEYYQNLFRSWKQIFDQGNFPLMFSDIFEKTSVRERHLSRINGERIISNIEILVQILSEWIICHPHPLEHWIQTLQLKIEEDIETPMPIDRDSSAVSVMTIHSSKGLEFPIVFFPGGFMKWPNSGNASLYFYSKSGKKYYVLWNDKKSMEEHLFEEMEEFKRLLYVALTRAKSYLCLPLINFKRKDSLSLINQLWNKETSLEERIAYLSHPSKRHQFSLTHVSKLPSFPTQNFTQPSLSLDLKYSLATAEFGSRCNLAESFTRFSHTLDEEKEDVLEEAHSLKEVLPQTANQSSDILPKGAATGILLHEVFEKIDFSMVKKFSSQEKFSQDPDLILFLETLLKKHAISSQWIPTIINLTWNSLKIPLFYNGGTFTLSEITEFTKEWEFRFLIQNKSPFEYSLPQEKIRLNPEGDYLKGIVDLIFRHKGKYYILDWKSNYLGNSPSDYSKEALLSDMTDHRYHLQYTLYTIGLLAFLKQTDPTFNYETHFGGIFYLYLRGLPEPDTFDSSNPGALQGIFFSKPAYVDIKSLALKLLNGPVKELFLEKGFSNE